MFLNFLSISASNVLKMSLNIIVNIAGVHWLYCIHTNKPVLENTLLISVYHGRQERSVIKIN